MTTDRSGAWLSEVGLAYAEHYREVDAARRAFRGERARLLAHLAEPLASAVRATLGGEVTVERERDDGWVTLACPSEYGRVRVEKKGSFKKGSGVALALDDWQERWGFQTLAWFGMGSALVRALDLGRPPRGLLDALGAELGAVESRYVDGYWYLRLAVVPPGDPRFALASFSELTASLPETYARADRWLAAQYAGYVGGED